ncbi:hypothetical protein D9611_006103 [Ephemerocybe angulata]|uniref:MYND-type domain-containing protein n=1 Tax=Ephemerocybe angulata TaxID=980116 RepID=A0A8H5CI54_9AGAR|nr:hypothetical protein D9611_006103 [Tulosesus angulatus]
MSRKPFSRSITSEPITSELLSRASAGSESALGTLHMTLMQGGCTPDVVPVVMKFLSFDYIPSAQSGDRDPAKTELAIKLAKNGLGMLHYVLTATESNLDIKEVAIPLLVESVEALCSWINFLVFPTNMDPLRDDQRGRLHNSYCNDLRSIIATDKAVLQAFISSPRFLKLVLRLWMVNGDTMTDINSSLFGNIPLLISCLEEEETRDALCHQILTDGHSKKLASSIIGRMNQARHTFFIKTPLFTVVDYVGQAVYIITRLIHLDNNTIIESFLSAHYVTMIFSALDLLAEVVENANPSRLWSKPFLMTVINAFDLVLNARIRYIYHLSEAIERHGILTLGRLSANLPVKDCTELQEKIRQNIQLILNHILVHMLYPEVLDTFMVSGAYHFWKTTGEFPKIKNDVLQVVWEGFWDRAQGYEEVYKNMASGTPICDNMSCDIERRIKPSRRCSQCLSVSYCTEQCQSEDWNRFHRKECRHAKHNNDQRRVDHTRYRFTARQLQASWVEMTCNVGFTQLEEERMKQEALPDHAHHEVVSVIDYTAILFSPGLNILPISLRHNPRWWIRTKSASFEEEASYLSPRMTALVDAYRSGNLGAKYRLVELDLIYGVEALSTLMLLKRLDGGEFKVLLSRASAGSLPALNALQNALMKGECTPETVPVVMKFLSFDYIPSPESGGRDPAKSRLAIDLAVKGLKMLNHILQSTHSNADIKKVATPLLVESVEALCSWMNFLVFPTNMDPFWDNERGQLHNYYSNVLLNIILADTAVLKAFISSPRFLKLVLRLWMVNGDTTTSIGADLKGNIPLLTSCLEEEESRDALFHQILHDGVSEKLASSLIGRINRAHHFVRTAPQSTVVDYVDQTLNIIIRLTRLENATILEAFASAHHMSMIFNALDVLSESVERADPGGLWSKPFFMIFTNAVNLLLDSRGRYIHHLSEAVERHAILTLGRLSATIPAQNCTELHQRILVYIHGFLNHVLAHMFFPQLLVAFMRSGAYRSWKLGNFPQIQNKDLQGVWRKFWVAAQECEDVYMGMAPGTAICDNASCDDIEERIERSRRCSQCLSVSYCSEHCQSVDWNRFHREECRHAKRHNDQRRVAHTRYRFTARQLQASWVEAACNNVFTKLKGAIMGQETFPDHAPHEIVSVIDCSHILFHPTNRVSPVSLQHEPRWWIRTKHGNFEEEASYLNPRITALVDDYRSGNLGTKYRLVELNLVYGVEALSTLMLLQCLDNGEWKVAYSIPRRGELEAIRMIKRTPLLRPEALDIDHLF